MLLSGSIQLRAVFHSQISNIFLYRVSMFSHLSVSKFPSPFLPVDPFNVVNSLHSHSSCYFLYPRISRYSYIRNNNNNNNKILIVIITLGHSPLKSRVFHTTGGLIFHLSADRCKRSYSQFRVDAWSVRRVNLHSTRRLTYNGVPIALCVITVKLYALYCSVYVLQVPFQLAHISFKCEKKKTVCLRPHERSENLIIFNLSLI